MKTIAETLGVARSNLIERRDDAKPKRGQQDRPGDRGSRAPISGVWSISVQPMAAGGSIRSSSASGDPTARPRSTQARLPADEEARPPALTPYRSATTPRA